MPYLLFWLLAFSLAHAQPAQTLTTYEGSINDRYPVSLTLTTGAGVAHGTLVYRRSGLPIRVVGTLENGNLRLHEFDARRTITGTFSGQASAKGFLGTWRSPRPNAPELRFSLTQASRQPAPPVSAGNLTGTYGFSFGKDGPTGQLYVQQLSPTRLAVALEGLTGGPAYNQALIGKTVLPLRDNEALYHSDEFGSCTLRLIFFGRGAVVSYVGSDDACGFGHAATVTGNYVKTSDKLPIFTRPD